jgi:hypothetical protein
MPTGKESSKRYYEANKDKIRARYKARKALNPKIQASNARKHKYGLENFSSGKERFKGIGVQYVPHPTPAWLATGM